MIYESLIILVNHKSLNSPAYFISEFYCKPNCQVTKLSSYQIISYQIVGYQIVSYQIINYQIVSYTSNLLNNILSEMGLFCIAHFCVLSSVDCLKSHLESKSRLPISEI